MTAAWRSFGQLLPVVVLAALLAVILLVTAWRGSPSTRHKVLRSLLGLWASVFIAITLMPNRGLVDRSVDLIPFQDILRTMNGVGGVGQIAAQIGGNILIAAPLGVMLRIYLGPGGAALRRSLLWSGLFFCLIEIAQFVLPLGRATTTDDVLIGLSGFVIGWLGCQVAGQIAQIKPRYKSAGGSSPHRAARR
jgi:glycopeptide antibiotics resistance protein